MKKVAITLPDDQADAIERLRRRRGLPRSRIIQEAIAQYLADGGRRAAAREYAEGYRRLPEGGDAEAFVAAASGALVAEEW